MSFCGHLLTALLVFFLCLNSVSAAESLAAASGQSPAAGNNGVIREGEVLSLQRCIETALARHPSLYGAAGTIQAATSRVGQAESIYYPQVDLLSSFTGGSSDTVLRRQDSEFTIGGILRQNIYDFGRRPAQVEIRRYGLDSSRMDFRTVTDQVVFNVRQAYYSVLRTGRNRNVAVEVVKQFEQHLEQARDFFRVGLKPKFDVTKAEVDLSNARLSLITVENNQRLSWVNLKNAMGVPEAPDFQIERALQFEPSPLTLEQALEKAFESRPDLKSLTALEKAAESSLKLAERNYYPVVTGTIQYSSFGNRLPLEEDWTVGALVTVPVFNGFLTRHQIDEARANLVTIRAEKESLRQRVILEIQQAFLNLQEARERISAAQLNVQQAKENLEIARGRYDAGIGHPIEVTDALVAYGNAETAYTSALYDYKIDEANIEKAIGEKLWIVNPPGTAPVPEQGERVP
ncbi:MAG TPA: TolC family protein [Dissulfurispiraceae bacterium]|nr:TolC family protein [Dissulfurispiraceae bacterium]